MFTLRILFLLLCGFIYNLACAEKLTIKMGAKTVSLPFWPAAEKQPNYGAVLLVYGGQPQWSELLAHIAARLGRIGWSVVLLNSDGRNKESWVVQMPEVISTLRKNKNYRIVLIHYGEQLQQTIDYFTKPQAKMITGLIMLSAYNEAQEQTIPNVRFPLFDIVGQFDYDVVVHQASNRKQAQQQRPYVQVEIPGASHDYEYSKGLLVSFVHGWMAKLPEAKPSPRPISYLVPVFSSQHRVVLGANTFEY